MLRSEFVAFEPVEGEDCHARTLRAIEEWHRHFGFWPSVRDLCWFTEDTSSSSTMHERIRILARTGKIEAILNPRKRRPIGYRVK